MLSTCGPAPRSSAGGTKWKPAPTIAEWLLLESKDLRAAAERAAQPPLPTPPARHNVSSFRFRSGQTWIAADQLVTDDLAPHLAADRTLLVVRRGDGLTSDGLGLEKAQADLVIGLLRDELGFPEHRIRVELDNKPPKGIHRVHVVATDES